MADVFNVQASINLALQKLAMDLKKGEKMAVKSAENIEKKSSEAIGGLGSNVANRFAKIFAAAGTIELGFAGSASLLQGMRGDFDAMAQSVEALPAGIGPMIRAMRLFKDAVTGATKAQRELARNQALTELFNQNIKDPADRLRMMQIAEGNRPIAELQLQRDKKASEIRAAFAPAIQEAEEEKQRLARPAKHRGPLFTTIHRPQREREEGVKVLRSVQTRREQALELNNQIFQTMIQELQAIRENTTQSGSVR